MPLFRDGEAYAKIDQQDRKGEMGARILPVLRDAEVRHDRLADRKEVRNPLYLPANHPAQMGQRCL